MSAKSVVDLLTSTAKSAVRHPVSSAGYVAGLAKGATEATMSLVRGRSVPEQRGRHTEGTASDTASDTASPAPSSQPEAPRPTGERTNFGGLNREAAPPQFPGGGGENYEHHPSAETRDIGHGDAPADPQEVASWTEDLDVGRGAPTIDVETPVGTAAADIGRNPDTDDVDLQQPGTEPLVDPGTAKAVRSEAEMLQKAADPDKG